MMLVQPVTDFHPFHAFRHQELDDIPLLHFHEKRHFFEIMRVISAGLVWQ
jgi:hypothetical protein